jgi:hypothetical protein
MNYGLEKKRKRYDAWLVLKNESTYTMGEAGFGMRRGKINIIKYSSQVVCSPTLRGSLGSMFLSFLSWFGNNFFFFFFWFREKKEKKRFILSTVTNETSPKTTQFTSHS